MVGHEVFLCHVRCLSSCSSDDKVELLHGFTVYTLKGRVVRHIIAITAVFLVALSMQAIADTSNGNETA